MPGQVFKISQLAKAAIPAGNDQTLEYLKMLFDGIGKIQDRQIQMVKLQRGEGTQEAHSFPEARSYPDQRAVGEAYAKAGAPAPAPVIQETPKAPEEKKEVQPMQDPKKEKLAAVMLEEFKELDGDPRAKYVALQNIFDALKNVNDPVRDAFLDRMLKVVEKTRS